MASLRMANWDRGEAELRGALEIASKRNDFVQLSGLWNNLACSALEQGDWVRFEECAEHVETIAAELPDPIDAALPMMLNKANSKFYQGRSKEALALYCQAFEMANQAGSEEFIPELLACKGLTALQLGFRADADQAWQDLGTLRTDLKSGSQEEFKLEWLAAYMNRRQGPEEAKKRIREAAEMQEDLDYPGHLKLLVLTRLLFKDSELDASAVQEKVSEAGLSWFPRFASRWLKSAEALRTY
jgi:tetratricopeptide (TPR) repeat protein